MRMIEDMKGGMRGCMGVERDWKMRKLRQTGADGYFFNLALDSAACSVPGLLCFWIVHTFVITWEHLE